MLEKSNSRRAARAPQPYSARLVSSFASESKNKIRARSWSALPPVFHAAYRVRVTSKMIAAGSGTQIARCRRLIPAGISRRWRLTLALVRPVHLGPGVPGQPAPAEATTTGTVSEQAMMRLTLDTGSCFILQFDHIVGQVRHPRHCPPSAGFANG
jgi:hypothetical protein